MSSEQQFARFLDIINTLLGENGCPWDKEQTFESLRPCILEECYEVLDAIDKKSTTGLQEELGDVFLHIMMMSKMADTAGLFTLEDVIDGICNKMILRHPHIFADVSVSGTQQVLDNWEKIKDKEKGLKRPVDNLTDVPKALPALVRAEKVQKRAVRAGLCTEDDVLAALDKMQEQINVLKDKISEKNQEVETDLGQLLFQTVSISRKLKINPEFSLTNALETFITNFELFEKDNQEAGKTIRAL